MLITYTELLFLVEKAIFLLVAVIYTKKWKILKVKRGKEGLLIENYVLVFTFERFLAFTLVFKFFHLKEKGRKVSSIQILPKCPHIPCKYTLKTAISFMSPEYETMKTALESSCVAA